MANFELKIGDPICEDLAIRWQFQAINLLDHALKGHGVSDRQVRQRILEEFFFHTAVQLDGSSEGIEFEGRQYRPRLVFESSDTPPSLFVSDKYDLHDYTHSDIMALFEENAE